MHHHRAKRQDGPRIGGEALSPDKGPPPELTAAHAADREPRDQVAVAAQPAGVGAGEVAEDPEFGMLAHKGRHLAFRSHRSWFVAGAPG
jgi:hypothetical protein